MKPLIFGHRGIPSLAPENSLKSFSKLLKYSVPGVELDVHLTKDGKLVVIHDFNTKKVSGVDLEVTDSDYRELMKLDIGDGERIPLLSQVFDLLSDRIYYDIEIKSRGKKRLKTVKEVVKTLLNYAFVDKIMVSSFDPWILKLFNREQKKYSLNIPTAIIYSRDKDVPLLLRSGLGLFFTRNSIIKPHYKALKGFHFWLYRRILNKRCYTWTVNSKEDYLKAINEGAEGVCSNIPQELLKVNV